MRFERATQATIQASTGRCLPEEGGGGACRRAATSRAGRAPLGRPARCSGGAPPSDTRVHVPQGRVAAAASQQALEADAGIPASLRPEMLALWQQRQQNPQLAAQRAAQLPQVPAAAQFAFMFAGLADEVWMGDEELDY